MLVTDADTVAVALSRVPLKSGRKCQRRNLAKRLRSGRTEDLTGRDLHLIRQARYVDRVGVRAYDRAQRHYANDDAHRNRFAPEGDEETS